MLNLIQHLLFQGIAGQARNDGADRAPKSRRDDLLLTDGFNRRMSGNVRPLQSPEGTAFCRAAQGTSLRDFGVVCRASLVRRLKPTVNKGSSFQDFASLTLSTLGGINKGACPLAENHQRPMLGSICNAARDGSNIGVMLNLIQHPLFQEIAGQARNDGADRAPKSRRDDLLLTDGFNRRMSGNVRPTQSPKGTALCRTVQGTSLRVGCKKFDSISKNIRSIIP